MKIIITLYKSIQKSNEFYLWIFAQIYKHVFRIECVCSCTCVDKPLHLNWMVKAKKINWRLRVIFCYISAVVNVYNYLKTGKKPRWQQENVALALMLITCDDHKHVYFSCWRVRKKTFFLWAGKESIKMIYVGIDPDIPLVWNNNTNQTPTDQTQWNKMVRATNDIQALLVHNGTNPWG